MVGYDRVSSAILISLVGILFVVSPIMAEAREGSSDVVEIGDPSSKSRVLVDREMLKSIVNVDREISRLGIRLFDYDRISLGFINTELIGLQVIRIPKDGVNTKEP